MWELEKTKRYLIPGNCFVCSFVSRSLQALGSFLTCVDQWSVSTSKGTFSWSSKILLSAFSSFSALPWVSTTLIHCTPKSVFLAWAECHKSVVHLFLFLQCSLCAAWCPESEIHWFTYIGLLFLSLCCYIFMYKWENTIQNENTISAFYFGL